MITEDYVSFETAKLLKEKGFREHCTTAYFPKKTPTVRIERPTLQMAMKWLREMHKIDIWVECHNSNRRYKGYIHSEQRGDEALFYEDSYEQACEAAIKYCLEKFD